MDRLKPNKNVFKIEITETLQRTIYIEDDSREEALKRVIDMYDMGDIVLDDNDLVDSFIDDKDLDDGDIKALENIENLHYIRKNNEEVGGFAWLKE